MTDSQLLARVQRIEDHLALQQLIASYCIAVDNRDYDAVAEHFTEDGRFYHKVGFTDAKTRAGIRQFYEERLGAAGPTYHYPHSQVLTFEDDRNATGIVTSHAEMGIADKMIIVGMRYYDRYRKGDDDRWRFVSREIWFHYFMPADELPQRYSDEIRRTWPGDPLPADLPDSLPTYRHAKGLD